MKFLCVFTLIITMFTSNLYAAALKYEFRGDLNTQVKSLTNSSSAKKLGQDWDQENIHLFYGNYHGEVNFKKSTLHVNWFFRYSESELYRNDYSATDFSNYPSSTIRRDIFKFSKVENGSRSFTESTLNQFAYEWGDSETKWKIGRFFIEYGNGQTFNPINPFSPQLTFANIDTVNQGNDGMQFFLNSSDDLNLYLYILNDKQFENEDKLARTIFIRGDWQVSNKVHVNYIIGEDQKRHKYGFDVSYDISAGSVYAQVVRQSQRLDKNDTQDDDGLFHYLIGYTKAHTSNFQSHIEFGKFSLSEQFPEGAHQRNILPIEDFVSIIPKYYFNDNNSIKIAYALEPSSEFSYYRVSYDHIIGKRFLLTLFTSGVGSEAKDETRYASRRVIPNEYGLNLRFIY